MNIRQISVIVCTLNRANLLPRVISQLRAQDYPADAFEIIVVDHGSTDTTQQIVEKLVVKPGAPVIYICETRPGITFARNRGAEVAHNPYLAYLDDDCSIEANWLSQLVQGFDLHDDVVAVGGQVVLDWDQQEKPAWLEPRLETWLAAYSHSGNQPQLLEKGSRIIEGNMALTQEAWKISGGFLGMEHFGSQNFAATEIAYLLRQIECNGGKIAYVPDAVAHHHVGKRSWRFMLRRGYYQGVSDGILDYLIHRRSWRSTASHLVLDAAAMIVLFICACFPYLKADQAKGLFYLARAIRRLGLILSKMHLVGDWPRVRLWMSTHHPNN
jgi:glycosyltransferase involved in cell wall biosynthesis